MTILCHLPPLGGWVAPLSWMVDGGHKKNTQNCTKASTFLFRRTHVWRFLSRKVLTLRERGWSTLSTFFASERVTWWVERWGWESTLTPTLPRRTDPASTLRIEFACNRDILGPFILCCFWVVLSTKVCMGACFFRLLTPVEQWINLRIAWTGLIA